MILDLPLAHSELDADTAARTEQGLIERLRGEPGTRVVLVDDIGAIALRGAGLDVVSAAAHTPREDTLLVYLGRSGDGAAHLLAVGPRLGGHAYHDLRTVMADMPPADRGIAVPAVAVANWHRSHAFCPRCGHQTDVGAAGWVRSCGECRTEHYPRTDPAVIMAVVDGADRLLLAHARHFSAGRYSMVAGYVEPGESLEHAVVRETREEVGLEVTAVTYRGSQPWPFPRSLMFAFEAMVAGTPAPRVDGVEITDARFFTRAELAAAVASGELALPGAASVAHRLLEHWYGGPVPA